MGKYEFKKMRMNKFSLTITDTMVTIEGLSLGSRRLSKTIRMSQISNITFQKKTMFRSAFIKLGIVGSMDTYLVLHKKEQEKAQNAVNEILEKLEKLEVSRG